MHPDAVFVPFVEYVFVWRLIAATILGSLMGLDRSIAGKHAGMRTYALVSLGSCIFAIVGTLASYQLAGFAGINPLQIASSVVIGIGFIGSGIAATRGSQPPELTTATGIWVVSAVGLAVGFGFYLTAVVATLLSLFIFSVAAEIEHWVRVRWG